MRRFFRQHSMQLRVTAIGGVADRASGVLDAYDELPKMPPELQG